MEIYEYLRKRIFSIETEGSRWEYFSKKPQRILIQELRDIFHSSVAYIGEFFQLELLKILEFIRR